MSITAAQLVVKVTSQGISETRSALGGLGEGIKSTAGHIGGFMGGLLDMGSKLGMTVFGVKNLIDTVGGLGQALLGSNATLEQQRVAFTGLLGSAQNADAFLRQMQQFAAATPFEFPDLVVASQRMLAMGFTAQEVQPMLTAVGDAAAGMGAGKDQVDAIILALGQMHAAGKVHLQDLMQITNTGVPALKLLADGFGVSTAEMQNMISAGTVPADKAIGILRTGMEKMYGGQMANQATTFNGLMSTLADNARMALTAFAGPLFTQAKGALENLGNLVSSSNFQAFAKTVGQDVGDALGKVTGLLGDHVLPLFSGLFDSVDKVAGPVKTLSRAFGGVGDAVERGKPALIAHKGLISQIADFVGHDLVPAFTSLGTYFVQNILPNLLKFGQFVQTTVLPALGQFAAFLLTNVIPTLLKLEAWIQTAVLPTIQTLATVFLQNVLPALEQVWTSIAENLLPALEHLMSKILPILTPLLQLLGWILQHIVGPAIALVFFLLGKLIDVIATIIGWIGDFLGWLGNLKDKGLDAAGAAFQKLGQIAGGVWDGIKTSAKGAINSVIDVIDGLIRAINGIHIHVPKIDLPGGGSIGGGDISFPQIPQIPHLARGGVLTRSGAVLVGDAGPEYLNLPRGAQVRPLSAGPGDGGGGSISIGELHIHTPATDGARIWQEMKDAMRREERKRNGQ